MRSHFPPKRFFILSAILSGLLMLLAACNPAPKGPMDDQGNIIGQAEIQSVAVRISGESPPYDILVEVKGTLPDACTSVGKATVSRQDDHFQVEVATLRPAKERCKKEPQSFTKTIPLNGLGLPAGDYAVLVNGIQSSFALAQDNAPPTPTPTATPLPPVLLPAIEPPTATPEPTPAVTPAPAEAENNACIYRVIFVKDVTVPDNARINPGARFTKTWRLKNGGSCVWPEDVALVFAGGEQMNGPDSQPLGATVKPGKSVDVSVELVAPAAKGAYTSEWLLQTPAGERFGLGGDGKTPFWVKIRVPRNAPASDAANGVISGFVWHDLCAADQATADSLPEGCDIAPGGGVMADGVYQPGEPPIGSAEIALGAGPCPSSGLAVIQAEANGKYAFKELKAGEYCVSIDAASDYNHYIFIPGRWTHPPDGQQTVTLTPGETKTNVNFGWDYELAP